MFECPGPKRMSPHHNKPFRSWASLHSFRHGRFQSQKLAQYKQNELIIRSRINQVTQKAEADALITLENATAQGNRKVEVGMLLLSLFKFYDN